jgi:hypothetical protein
VICKTALRKLVFESQIVMLLRPGLDSLNTTGAMRFRPRRHPAFLVTHPNAPYLSAL